MTRSVQPSLLTGNLNAPPSKSMMQRIIAGTMLAKGRSMIQNPSYCDDSLAAMSIATNLGASLEPDTDKILVTSSLELRERELNCGESGLAIRMFSPIAALFGEEIKMTGTGSLKKRPMHMICEALNQLDVKCTSTGGYLPLTITGPVKGGVCKIDGSLSSQLLTGLLMSLPLAENDSAISVTNLRSRPYIDMTIKVLMDFGIKISNENYEQFIIPGKQLYNPGNYKVEGDWSGGSFLLVAGAINGNLIVSGLQPDSSQSDAAILKALKYAGADIIVSSENIEVRKSKLIAFDFDATESPDLFPPLVALAAYCKGTTQIKGVSRLAHKESDRGASLTQEFGKMGINIKTEDDLMFVVGGKVKGARIDSHGDHRIAMAAAVAALGSLGTIFIDNAQCVAKSYPGFFDDLQNLGAVIKK